MEELERQKTIVRADERRVGFGYGRADEEAAESFELAKRLALEERLRNQLAEVEHALHKFDQGTYGLCDACGQPIDPARLEALPQANLCLGCRAQKEKKAKFPQARQGERIAYSDEKVTLTIADWVEDMEGELSGGVPRWLKEETEAQI